MTTRLYFLRHATAQDRTLPIPDAERALTEKGLSQARAVAGFCERQGLLPQRLLCSPLVRAVETATQFSHRLPDCPMPQIVDWLRLGTPAQEALAHLRDTIDTSPAAGSLWMVGHEPDLSDLISRLLGSPHPIVRVKKASLTCLTVQAHRTAPPGQLLWSVPCALMG
ncbi:histidine phosphatase family protein [Sphaerotilus sp.]|uniref:SixA phosphatase family protein n=1 Tax=Sphaerotilus sp. TaxID=2093942 RepID=UPI0034E20263